jgi:peptidylprolyl isomerase
MLKRSSLLLLALIVVAASASMLAARQDPPAKPADIPAPADVAAAPKGAERSPSGLASIVITKGTGKNHPNSSSTVTVNYTGWTTAGKMVDTSRGKPMTRPLGAFIKGWTEGVQLMVVGETRRFWIPGKLAYDDAPGMPKGMLVFDIELIAIK